MGSNKDAPTFPVQVAEEERRAVIGQRPQRRGLEEDTELYIEHILLISLMRRPYEPSRGGCRCVSPESGVGSSIPANRPQRSWLLWATVHANEASHLAALPAACDRLVTFNLTQHHVSLSRVHETRKENTVLSF